MSRLLSRLLNTSRPVRSGTTLIEMMLLLSLTGGLMLMTVRVLTLATQVQEMGIHTTTHLRLASSLEDRLHSDIARAIEVEVTATNELRLTMPDSTGVLYALSEPNLMERQTVKREVGAASPAVGQRWQFEIPFEMRLDLKPAQSRTLVRVRLSRLPTDKPWRMLREVEVVEVSHEP